MSDGRNYKIGYTDRTPQERVRELMANSSTYYEITIEAYTEVLRGRDLEKFLHDKYSDKRIDRNREWFSLNDNDVATIHNIFKEKAIGDCLAPKSRVGRELAKQKRIKEAKIVNEKRIEEEKILNEKRIEEEKKSFMEKIRRSEVESISLHNGKIAQYWGWGSLVFFMIAGMYLRRMPELWTYLFIVLIVSVFFSLIVFLFAHIVLDIISKYKYSALFKNEPSDFFREVLIALFWVAVAIGIGIIKINLR